MFQQINTNYPGFHFRYLEPEDYNRGLFDTLGQLTQAPVPKYEDFLLHLNKMKQSSQDHVNIVGIDKKNNQVIAFGTLLICKGPQGKTGKIENIVTSKAVRGKGLGKCIIQILKWIGWDRNCPKISLFCEQKNVEFYNKLGFKRQGIISAWYGP